MSKLKVNRRDFADPKNIEKIVIKKDGMVWVYRKKGYPKVFKCLEGIYTLKVRLVNIGCQLTDFIVEKE